MVFSHIDENEIFTANDPFLDMVNRHFPDLGPGLIDQLQKAGSMFRHGITSFSSPFDGLIPFFDPIPPIL
jgi:hypothetical protein